MITGPRYRGAWVYMIGSIDLEGTTVPDFELVNAVQQSIEDANLSLSTPFTAAVRIGDEIAGCDIPAAGLSGRHIDRTSILYTASLAKQITGACVAIALDRNLLNLDDSLASWLPDLPNWAEHIKLRHLLSHTTALPGEPALVERMVENGQTARTTMGLINALGDFEELHEAPGTRFTYSNIGYVCLASIVGRAAGESFDAFAAHQIFGPLDMSNTSFWPDTDTIPDGAVGVDDDPIIGKPCSLGDGGLWTTVDDFTRWNDAMNNDQLGISRIVQQRGALDDGSPLDYAWGIRIIEHRGHIGMSHGGSWPGIHVKSVRFPALGSSFVAFTLDHDIDPILRFTGCVQDVLANAQVSS